MIPVKGFQIFRKLLDPFKILNVQRWILYKANHAIHTSLVVADRTIRCGERRDTLSMINLLHKTQRRNIGKKFLLH